MAPGVVPDHFRPEDFVADGSLRDVCILDAGISVWERLVQRVPTAPGRHEFSIRDEPAPLVSFSVADYFARMEAGEDISARLLVEVGGIPFVTFFFEPGEIEFTFGPEDLRDGEEFESLKAFMIWLSTTCDRQVIVTMETSRHADIPRLLQTAVA